MAKTETTAPVEPQAEVNKVHKDADIAPNPDLVEVEPQAEVNKVHKDADIALNPDWVEVEVDGRKIMRKTTVVDGVKMIEERY